MTADFRIGLLALPSKTGSTSSVVTDRVCGSAVGPLVPSQPISTSALVASRTSIVAIRLTSSGTVSVVGSGHDGWGAMTRQDGVAIDANEEPFGMWRCCASHYDLILVVGHARRPDRDPGGPEADLQRMLDAVVRPPMTRGRSASRSARSIVGSSPTALLPTDPRSGLRTPPKQSVSTRFVTGWTNTASSPSRTTAYWSAAAGGPPSLTSARASSSPRRGRNRSDVCLDRSKASMSRQRTSTSSSSRMAIPTTSVD
jgi:hypothetical protein